jgi:nicotinamidase-related amidase
VDQNDVAALDPRRVAVLMVDFQNQFCHRDAATSGSSNRANAATAELANTFARRAAGLGAHVVYTRQVFDPAELTERQRRWDEELGLCRKGSWEAELFVEPVAGSHTIEKHRFDIWQSAGFVSWLEARDIDGFAVAGVELRCCVLFAVLGADERGYRVTVPLDLVSGLDEGDATYNRAARDFLRFTYQAPPSSDFILDAWRATSAHD